MAHAGVILGLAVDGVLVEDVATTVEDLPRLRRRVEHRGAGRPLVTTPLLRARPRALRAAAPPHPPAHQGPPDVRRRRPRPRRDGRPRPLHPALRGPPGDGDEVAPAGPQGRRRRRPRARGRRHERRRRVAGPHRRGRPPHDDAAPHRRRRRPGRAGDRLQRRPARRGDGAGRPRAAPAPDRPRARGGVRRRDGAAALPDQGRPRRPRDPAVDLPLARRAVGGDPAQGRLEETPPAT